jgi:hypothetical protein
LNSVIEEGSHRQRSGRVVPIGEIGGALASANRLFGIHLPWVTMGGLFALLVLHELPGGAALIGTTDGWYRFDPPSERMVSAGDAPVGYVRAVRDLPGGAVLIGGLKGLFSFDPTSGRVVPAGGRRRAPCSTCAACQEARC